MLSCLHILFVIFTLQWHSWAVATETIWLAKPKLCTIWPIYGRMRCANLWFKCLHSLIGIHFFKCLEFIYLLSKWSNKDWIYLLSETKTATKPKLKLDKVYETRHFRRWMSGYENEGEQSLRNRKPTKWTLQLSQLTASKAFLDHSIGKENPGGIQPTPRVGKM